MRLNWLIGCAWVAMTATIVFGQATTRPGGATPGLDRLRTSLEGLDLSDDQKGQIKTVFEDAREKVLEMRQNGGQTPQATQQVMAEIRQKLASILTPAQLQALRAKMQQGGQGVGPTTPPPAARNQGNADAPLRNGAPLPEGPKVIDAGKPAPGFRLSTLGGSVVDLSSLKGRVVVLVFGSYSSPMLRDRAQGLNQLMMQEETRAEVYLVYTKEMHPVGGWDSDRNEEDHIVQVQPKTMEEKRSAALQCRVSLNLSMPVLVDDLQDSTTTAYGAFPDGAVVINRDGTIAGSQQWTEPTALRRMVEEAAGKKFHAETP